MEERGHRRRYFVQRGFQGRFIAIFVALVVAGGVAAAAASGVLVHRALTATLFRAHIAERSTGEIVLPWLVRVNGLCVAVTLAVAAAVGFALFRRQARAVDALCTRLAAWREALQAGGVPADGPPLGTEWAAAVDRALGEADATLRAAYGAASARARELADEAERLARGSGDAAHALESLDEKLAAVDDVLSRFQSPEEGPS
ncbi:MAG: hypothetical protein ACOC8D_00155 [bacterium]